VSGRTRICHCEPVGRSNPLGPLSLRDPAGVEAISTLAVKNRLLHFAPGITGGRSHTQGTYLHRYGARRVPAPLPVGPGTGTLWGGARPGSSRTAARSGAVSGRSMSPGYASRKVKTISLDLPDPQKRWVLGFLALHAGWAHLHRPNPTYGTLQNHPHPQQIETKSTSNLNKFQTIFA
jgi:hypothetical protein